MNRYILFFFLILSTLTTLRAQQSRLVEVGNGYSQTSVNTTVFRSNSLVTQGDEQYISYYDGDGYLVLGKRKLDSDQWTLKRTQYKGSVKDAHNIISMMLDGEGYLHLSFDHHGHNKDNDLSPRTTFRATPKIGESCLVHPHTVASRHSAGLHHLSAHLVHDSTSSPL